jgi:hypothetical protein
MANQIANAVSSFALFRVMDNFNRPAPIIPTPSSSLTLPSSSDIQATISLISMGVKVLKIKKVLHYDKRRNGNEIWGKSIEKFDAIKREGERLGNKGKRAFGKIGNNSCYGGYGLDWDEYDIDSSDKSNLRQDVL